MIIQVESDLQYGGTTAMSRETLLHNGTKPISL